MRVVAVESEDIPLEAIDAICKRVRFAAAQGAIGTLGLGVCANLIRLRYRLDGVKCAISLDDARTEADRTRLRKIARFHQRIADAMSGDRERIAAMQPPLLFRFAIVRLFDALVVQAEDLAETAALGASAEFADLVEKELMGRRAAAADG